MQISSLRIFLDLAETASFSRVAAMHDITQSAVSQQVRAMEKRFGVVLIERGRRSFALTAEGRVLLAAAKKIVQQFESLSDQFGEMRNVVAGDLGLAAVHSIGLHELPPFLRLFQSRYPDVRLETEYLRSSQVYDRVLDRAVDFGLVAFPTKRRGLTMETISTDRLVLICAPSHRFAKRRKVLPDDLVDEPFISFDPDLPTRKAIDRILKRHGVSIDPAFEFDNIETVKRVVEIENGISIVPEASVAGERRTKSLCTVEVAVDGLERPIGVLYRQETRMSLPKQRFLELLREKSLVSLENGKRASDRRAA